MAKSEAEVLIAGADPTGLTRNGITADQ